VNVLYHRLRSAEAPTFDNELLAVEVVPLRQDDRRQVVRGGIPHFEELIGETVAQRNKVKVQLLDIELLLAVHPLR